jgi:type VI secretion system protein ImpH
MAGANRQTPDSLIARLAERPFAFDFYAALRLLQSSFCDHPRTGYSESPGKDPVRFAQNPALDFAPATLAASDDPLVRRAEDLRRKNPARPPVIHSRHFGMFGPNGPLPLCLTEYARDRILHYSDFTFASFCNVFHHRLLSFFFRAWADANKTVDLDRAEDQNWPQFAGSLVGLGMESLLEREDDKVPARAKLYFAGRLVHQARNAEGLEAIIQDYFGLRTEVWPFFGRWLNLPEGSVCKLGDSPETGALGASVIVGSRVWTCQLHFRLQMGPMSFAEFERLLPLGASFRRLCDWVRLYSGDHFSWDVKLVLAKDEVPAVQMGRAGRLGWTTWLKTKPFDHDAEDLVLQGSS